MDEILADGLENMAEPDKGLWIIVGARGPVSATSVRTWSSYVQTIRARFSGLVTKGRLQKVDVSSLVGSDLLETAIRPVREAGVYEILLRESGESLGVERILEMLQSERKVQDIDV